jgi:hypothetical protein
MGYYKLAADLGNHVGMTKLGVASEFERGALKDQARALEWYRAGADAGNQEARFHLGFCLQHGLGCETDLTQSVQWYKQSADGGDIHGALAFATSLQFGVGCDVDFDEADKYANEAMRLPRSGQTPSTPSDRCLRALGKASFPRTRLITRSEPAPEASGSLSQVPPHAASERITDYHEGPPPKEPLRFLGFGGSSIVRADRNQATGQTFAVKQFRPEFFDEPRFFREVETLVPLNHPCILRIRGWTPPLQHTPAQIRTEIAENGSIRDILEKIGWGTRLPFWNPTGKAVLICGLALGMRWIHSKGIIHGDLTPSNILVNVRGEALISDFGLSCLESSDDTLTPDGATINYAAPEQFKESAPRKRQVDVYAFGLLVFEILTGTAVFPSSEYAFPTLKRIRSGQLPAVPDECGSLMQELLPRCWSRCPEKRPTFDEIIGDFRRAGFRIVPRADEVRLGLYVADIENWEAEELVRSNAK